MTAEARLGILSIHRQSCIMSLKRTSSQPSQELFGAGSLAEQLAGTDGNIQSYSFRPCCQQFTHAVVLKALEGEQMLLEIVTLFLSLTLLFLLEATWNQEESYQIHLICG